MAGIGVGMDHADRSAAAPMMMDRADGSLNGGGTLRSMETAATIEQFENVFGPSARDIKLDNQRHKRHQRWHLPDVLKGPNNYLTDRVDGLISDATNSPFTRNILPYVYMDQPDQKITWNVYSFDEGMASRVPYESAARVLPQTKRSYKGYIVRSGLAIQMEHNFMASEAGRLNFKRQLQQLVGSVQLTNDYDVHIALLTAPSYQREMDEKYMETDNNFAQCCRQYADMFGMVNKTPNALDILIEDAKKHVKLWGGQPPTFMLCNGALTASLTMLPEKTNYLTNGPDGAKRLAQGPELPSYRGLSIINTRQFAVESGARPRDMLRRRVRVGQYYFISDPAYEASEGGSKAQARTQTAYEFYDQSKDSFFRMTYDELRKKALKQSAMRDDPEYNGGAGGGAGGNGGDYYENMDPYGEYRDRLRQNDSCKKLAVLTDLVAVGRAGGNDLKRSSRAAQADFRDMRQKWTSVNTAVNLARLPSVSRSQASNQMLELYSNNKKMQTGVTPVFQDCVDAFERGMLQSGVLSEYVDAWIPQLFSEFADVAARVALRGVVPPVGNVMARSIVNNTEAGHDVLTRLDSSLATMDKQQVLAPILFNHICVEQFDTFPLLRRDNTAPQGYKVDYKKSGTVGYSSASEFARKLISGVSVCDLDDVVPGSRVAAAVGDMNIEVTLREKLYAYMLATPEAADFFKAYGAHIDVSSVRTDSALHDNLKFSYAVFGNAAPAVINAAEQRCVAFATAVAQNYCPFIVVPHIAKLRAGFAMDLTSYQYLLINNDAAGAAQPGNAFVRHGAAAIYDGSPAVDLRSPHWNGGDEPVRYLSFVTVMQWLNWMDKIGRILTAAEQRNAAVAPTAPQQGVQNELKQYLAKAKTLWSNAKIMYLTCFSDRLDGQTVLSLDYYDNAGNLIPKTQAISPYIADNNTIQDALEGTARGRQAFSSMSAFGMVRLAVSLYMMSSAADREDVSEMAKDFMKYHLAAPFGRIAHIDELQNVNRSSRLLHFKYPLSGGAPGIGGQEAVITTDVDLPAAAGARQEMLGEMPATERGVDFFVKMAVCCSRQAGAMFMTAVMDKLSYYQTDPEHPEDGAGNATGGRDGAADDHADGPVDLLLVRANIEHNMLGAIVARGGTQELGSTFWGQTEMSCYDDAQHGIWGMSYKYHAKALVTNNKNMMRLFDIAFDGYCGGMDATFVDASQESIDAFRDASFNRTEAYSGDSFLVFELPRDNSHSKAPRLPNPITWNWAGRIEDTKAKAAPDRGDVVCRDRYKHNLLYATNQPNSGLLDATARAALANSLQLLGMENLQHHITTTSGPPGHNTINNMTDLNNIFYHGYLAVYDGQGNRKSMTKGSGHLGACWEGVASVREGRGLPQPTGVPTLQHLV